MELDLYRCTAHGGSKDWAIMVMSDGDLRTYHCETGRPVRISHIPRATFNSTIDEMSRRIAEKTGKGYEYLGKAFIDSNRFKLKTPDPPPRGAQTFEWEIIRSLRKEEVHETLSFAVGQLSDVAAPDSIVYVPEEVALRATYVTSIGVGRWTFGFGTEGGIGLQGRGGGVLPDHGLLPRLIMLYLLRCFPDAIRMANDSEIIDKPSISRDSRFVGEKLFDYERVLRLGERLGLCVGRIDLTGSEDGAKRAFWF